MRNYQGKNVLITGGTHGMGFATAQMLLSMGAEVIITGSNEQRVAAAQEALGKGAVALRSDAASMADIQALAAELAPRDIRVNAVSPGFISTLTMGVSGATAAELAQFEALGNTITPMKRHGRMEDVASAVLFLGFEATFTTAAELTVDGGLSHQLTLPS